MARWWSLLSREVKAIYEASVNEHMELAKTDDLKSLWKLSEKTLSVIIEYIYEHFDVFRLLCVGGGHAVFLLLMMLSVWKPRSR